MDHAHRLDGVIRVGAQLEEAMPWDARRPALVS